MGRDSLDRHRRFVTLSYVFMFLALFTAITAVIAYFLSRKVVQSDTAEVWMQAQALWIMRSVVLFLILVVFAFLWFIPAFFIYWDSMIWVKTCTVIGVVFAAIAWLYLLNVWLKGFVKYIQKKAVF
ncbi:hypothetical protein [Acinetobacter sp. KS-LM10]|uniref:hypothetical protein n=1 Tax=Acinetobacter sp. KS-LM10 TaxID=3120518 RepID=UPI0030CE492C